MSKVTNHFPMGCLRPSDCDGAPCYRCAVDFALASLINNPDCECIVTGRKPCGKPCGALRPQWEQAFRRCDPSNKEWGHNRLGTKGIVYRRYEVDAAGTPVERVSNAQHEACSVESPIVSVAYIGKQDPEAAACELFPHVSDDPISFDAACILVAREVEAGRVVPEALRQWSADYLMGKVKRPAKKGKISGATLTRDKLICELIEEIVDALGLRPTASDRTDGASACHAVAAAFVKLGLLPQGYEAMSKIWNKRKMLRSFCSDQDW